MIIKKGDISAGVVSQIVRGIGIYYRGGENGR